MITRSLGKIIRGRCTPYSLMTAAILGACLGFAPGFLEAPGLIVALVACLAIVNANLFVAGAVAIGTRLVALALQPVLFALGRLLLDGPTTGLFHKLMNAPVLAYFGLERYVTSGGLLLGTAVGVGIGFLLVRMQSKLRAKLESAQNDSERYQRLTSNKWARWGTFIFFGGRKQEYSELSAKGIGNPVRILGLIGVLGLGGLAYGAQAILGSAFLENTLRSGLERANGATVDLSDLELDLSHGRFVLDGLALADSNELTADIFRGRTFEADLSTRSLLQKRLVIESLVISEASSGDLREIPGKPITDLPGEQEPPVVEDPSGDGLAGMSLEELLADVELWRDRLTRAERVLNQIGWGSDGGEAPPEGGEDDSGLSLEERLERQAAQWGYGGVIASHLMDEEPSVRVGEIVVAGFRIADFPDELFEFRLENLSSAPSLLDKGARVSLVSTDGDIRFGFDLGDREANGERTGRLSMSLLNLDVDKFGGGITIDGQPLAQGGSLDIELDGSFLRGNVDLPLALTLRNSTLMVPGYKPTQVESFSLPVGMSGPLNSPQLTINDDALIDALVAAGKDEMARRVREEVDGRVDEARDELEGRLQDELQERGLDLENLPGGAGEALDRAGGALGGLFGGKD
ncbi:MAG: hypothetical protein ACI8PQ_001285 [Planctomycetota bacterium]|jgi:uncharacterized protein (TIGR03546 family)